MTGSVILSRYFRSIRQKLILLRNECVPIIPVRDAEDKRRSLGLVLGPRLVTDVRPGIGNEAVAVWHLHLRQGFGIHDLVISDDAVEI